jgi:hypothetical protein
MRLVFVSAAWRRYDVTRLALAQRAHLCGELAGRGIDATCVIVADDENLDIAQEFGFVGLERPNDYLGRKFNDGLEHACRFMEADFAVLIGSDDWMHIDLFDRLPLPSADLPELTAETQFVVGHQEAEVITGREIVLVDLPGGRMRHCESKGRYGVIPWILHRKALEPSGFRPIKDTLQRGIDGSLIAGLRMRPVWVFRDPHDLSRVDFKSDVSMSPYEQTTSMTGVGVEILDPWTELARKYPADLVTNARETSERMQPAPALRSAPKPKRSTLCFVVPAYRRFELTRVCLRQLVRTCEALSEHGIEATAVVVGDDQNLDMAEQLGFATVRRENHPLGRKFNDGIEYGSSPQYLGCDYVVPIGTDNWVDHELLLAQMPSEGMIGAHHLVTIIHESGERSVPLNIHYEGGDGIRTIPSYLLKSLAYRPADEDRERAVDTSIWNRLGRVHGGRPPFHYVDVHPMQVVGFQSVSEQLNVYGDLRQGFQSGPERADHWERLCEHYPPEAVDDAREVYERRMVTA